MTSPRRCGFASSSTSSMAAGFVGAVFSPASCASFLSLFLDNVGRSAGRRNSERHEGSHREAPFRARWSLAPKSEGHAAGERLLASRSIAPHRLPPLTTTRSVSGFGLAAPSDTCPLRIEQVPAPEFAGSLILLPPELHADRRAHLFVDWPVRRKSLAFSQEPGSGRAS